MKRLLILVTILLLSFVIFLLSPLNINAASSEETLGADENISNLENENTENSVRSIPGGEEPDNEQWYDVKLNNGVLTLKDDKYYNIDYSVMPELTTHLKPGDIIYEPNGEFIGDLTGHIAMVYDIVYDESRDQYYVITIESYMGGVQYGLMTPTRFYSKDVEIYRLTDASEEQVQGAVAWAQTQYGASWFFKPYKRTLPADNLIPTWYCAELIWASYYWQGIYLDQDDNNDFGSIVFPSEIAAYENAIPILHKDGKDYQAELRSNDDTYHTYSYNGKRYTEEHNFVYTSKGNQTHTVSCMCGYEATENHTLEYVILDDTLHREHCTACTYGKVQYHDYECTGVVDGVHTEACAGCEYSHDGLTNAVCTSIDEDNHSSVCPDCEYSVDSEPHNWVYTSINASYHEGHCSDCGASKGANETHAWTTYSPQYVKCMYCGHLKLKTGNVIIPVSPSKNDPEEETE